MTNITLLWLVTQQDALTLPHISTGVLLGLLLNSEDGSDVCFKHARIPINYKQLQPNLSFSCYIQISFLGMIADGSLIHGAEPFLRSC
jgi:hypothetical protein